jgi:hypothetical protein
MRSTLIRKNEKEIARLRQTGKVGAIQKKRNR